MRLVDNKIISFVNEASFIKSNPFLVHVDRGHIPLAPTADPAFTMVRHNNGIYSVYGVSVNTIHTFARLCDELGKTPEEVIEILNKVVDIQKERNRASNS